MSSSQTTLPQGCKGNKTLENDLVKPKLNVLYHNVKHCNETIVYTMTKHLNYKKKKNCTHCLKGGSY